MSLSRILHKKNLPEISVLVLVLAVSILAHSINLFNFPYFENDEGTYLSQAWAVIKYGDLAPYKYTFDHAPLGWIFTSIWVFLTGGFYTFGFSLNSGRVFVIVLHALSSIFLYIISKKLTGSRLASLFSILFFSLSPLAIYYQRRLLLDNIMVFWLLLAILFLSQNVKDIKKLFLASVAFSIAVLTKESALVFLPALLFLIFVRIDDFSVSLVQKTRLIEKFLILGKFLFMTLLLLSLYPLLAYLNNSLFASQSSTSLISGLLMQLNRTADVSNVVEVFLSWYRADPIFIVLGLVSLAISVIFSRRDKISRVTFLFVISYLVFLGTRKLIFDFYILPLVPFIAFNISYIGVLLSRFQPRMLLKAFPFIAMGSSLIVMLLISSRNINGNNLFTSNQTQPQKESVTWIINNVRPNSRVIIDNYAYLELNDEPSKGSSRYDYYWKVGTDPEIQKKFYNNNPNSVEMMVVTDQMRKDIANSNSLKFVSDALNNLKLIKTFQRDGWKVDIFSK